MSAAQSTSIRLNIAQNHPDYKLEPIEQLSRVKYNKSR